MLAAKLTLGCCAGLAAAFVHSVLTLWALFKTSSKACKSGLMSSSEVAGGSRPESHQNEFREEMKVGKKIKMRDYNTTKKNSHAGNRTPATAVRGLNPNH